MTKNLPDGRGWILVLSSTFPRWEGDTEPGFVFDLCRHLAAELEVTVLAPHAAGARLRETLPVAPAGFPQHVLRWRNQRWAERVGLGDLSAAEWEAHFARFQPLPGNMSAPLAMRYHGHQFRTYNPDIGDGLRLLGCTAARRKRPA